MSKFKWERKQFKTGFGEGIGHVGFGDSIGCEEIDEYDAFDERPDI